MNEIQLALFEELENSINYCTVSWENEDEVAEALYTLKLLKQEI